MNRDDIIRMAREAGFVLYDMHDVDGQDLGESVEADDHGALDRFAALVAAAEREACAQVCDFIEAVHTEGFAKRPATNRDLAAAIRARGTKFDVRISDIKDASVLEDAARYRWLREQNANLDEMTFYVGCDSGPDDQDAVEWVGVDLDAAIDAARAKEGQKP